MTPEERTQAIIGVTISKETICSFGKPKDWAWLALHFTPEHHNLDVARASTMNISGVWYTRVTDASKLLKAVGKKKRGIKQALARLEALERRYSKLMPRYFLHHKAVSAGGRFSKMHYRRMVLVELVKGTRSCDSRNLNSPYVKRIVADSGPLHIGRTNASVGYRKKVELERMCQKLNEGRSTRGTSTT